MNWLRHSEFVPRPLVAVEDHVYHISELLRTIRSTEQELLGSLCIVCLDRSGPDTDAAVSDWIREFPEIQVAARITDSQLLQAHSYQLFSIEESIFREQNEYCRFIASLIRKRGLLLQDIELETLEFVPRDRWWETTMLSSTVRGIVGERAPKCAFISNKRGYEATFGAELLAAGHDPRDVLNKYETERVVVPFLRSYFQKHFPWQLDWNNPSMGSKRVTCRLNSDTEEKADVESQLDLVLWPETDQMVALGGNALATQKKSSISLPTSGNEYQSWVHLIQAHLEGGPGIEIQALGTRVAPKGALRAEATNAAARHIHSLRKRLENPQDIVTLQGHYRLADRLSAGIATQV